jgi:hypothetical protein
MAGKVRGARCDTTLPVCAENLDSGILMMKAAKNRSRCDGAEPLNRPMVSFPISSRAVFGSLTRNRFPVWDNACSQSSTNRSPGHARSRIRTIRHCQQRTTLTEASPPPSDGTL